jgi:hypothetical protein
VNKSNKNNKQMSINLDLCTLITNEEYCKLPNPIFKGQTKINEETGGYYMVWESNGILYKTFNIM